MLTRPERLALLERDDQTMPIKSQAELLGLNRSGLYYQPLAPSAKEVALKHRVDELYTLRPFYGSRRITATLRREGWRLNRKAVQRHMREMGVAGISPGPNLSKRRSDHQVYPYLLRGLAINEPNQVWGIRLRQVVCGEVMPSYGGPLQLQSFAASSSKRTATARSTSQTHRASCGGAIWQAYGRGYSERDD